MSPPSDPQYVISEISVTSLVVAERTDFRSSGVSVPKVKSASRKNPLVRYPEIREGCGDSDCDGSSVRARMRQQSTF